MLFTAALKLHRRAGLAVALAARPRGHVVHVATRSPSGRAGVTLGRGRLRPVCGTRARRLHVLEERPSSAVLGAHQTGRPLCRRGAGRGGARSPPAPTRAEQPFTAAELAASARIALTPAEYWAVVAVVLARGSGINVRDIAPQLAFARAALGIGDDIGPGAHARTVRLNRRETAELVAAGEQIWPARDDDPDGRDRAMLAFERLQWPRPGAREAAIRDLFGVSLSRYLQRLHVVVEQPWALAAEPVLVNRVRAARDHARARRYA